MVGAVPAAINRFVSERHLNKGERQRRKNPFSVSSWMPAKRRQSGAELPSVFRGDQAKRSEELAFCFVFCFFSGLCMCVSSPRIKGPRGSVRRRASVFVYASRNGRRVCSPPIDSVVSIPEEAAVHYLIIQ